MRLKPDFLVVDESAELGLDFTRMKSHDFVGTLKLMKHDGGSETHVESQLSFFAIETRSSEVLGEIAVGEVGKVDSSSDWGKVAILVVRQ